MTVHTYSSVSRPYSAVSSSYRFPFRMSYLYLIVCAAILLMSWENVRNDAALAHNSIPGEAIRLRILANSDSAPDQAAKRVVRDAVVEAMDGWAGGPQTIEEARVTLRSHMSEIEAIVENTLRERGFIYSYKAELGEVAFPTKIYGERVYPAGDYEALLITLGQGEGQNWWCVLFPPLCFIDSASGDATPKAETAAAAASKGESADRVDHASHTENADNASDASNIDLKEQADQASAPEAKFFIWELIQSILSFLRNLFS